MLTWIISIVLYDTVSPGGVLAQPSLYPKNITTCEQFELKAKFNPYSIIDSKWKIIYFWSNFTEVYPITFLIPDKNRVKKFKEIFEATNPDTKEVEWEKAMLMMKPKPGIEVLYLYAGPGGAFRAMIQQEQRHKVRPYPMPLTSYADVRMKLVDRVLGMMCCEDLTAHAFVRFSEIPSTEEQCLKVASTIGYQGWPGRSYLTNEEELRRERDRRKEKEL